MNPATAIIVDFMVAIRIIPPFICNTTIAKRGAIIYKRAKSAIPNVQINLPQRKTVSECHKKG